jgi:4-oxalocrotonate tautomerase
MPYINLQITAGVTREQKASVVSEFTDTLVRVLNKSPEHIHIVIQEIAEEDWGYAGLLTDDWRKSHGSSQ